VIEAESINKKDPKTKVTQINIYVCALQPEAGYSPLNQDYLSLSNIACLPF
jgi:hypothetical protein